MKKVGKYKNWNLYWLGYDGIEDCFIVARNRRSAACLDADYCGYYYKNALVYKVTSIPESKARYFLKRKFKGNLDKISATYADQRLVKSVGGREREIDDYLETLVENTVYTTGADEVVLPRKIGWSFWEEFSASSMYQEYGYYEEDSYTESQAFLYNLLGVCVSRCQEIEYLIAHSTIFSVSDPKKHKYEFISDWIEAWKKKTFGRMLVDIEETFTLESEFKDALVAFKNMRNTLIHSITVQPRYDIHCSWGQAELIAFLVKFEFISRAVRKAFKASHSASIDLMNSIFTADNDRKKIQLSREQKAEVSLFMTFFELKEH